jgi:hypothetical protein
MLIAWDDGADGWRLWLRCGVAAVGDIIELGSGREGTAGTLMKRAWRRALRVSPVRQLHSAPMPTVDDVGMLTRVSAGRARPLQRLQQAVRRAGWATMMRRGHAGVHHDGWYITDEEEMVTPIRYHSTTGEWVAPSQSPLAIWPSRSLPNPSSAGGFRARTAPRAASVSSIGHPGPARRPSAVRSGRVQPAGADRCWVEHPLGDA